jgi:hypothetical protein
MQRLEALKKIVNDCMDQSDLSEWEGEFLESLQIQLDQGRELSPKQLKKLDEIDERE